MVLLIESDERLLKGMMRAVQAEVGSVYAAGSRERANDLLRRHHFDVIVSNLSGGESDARAVLESLQQRHNDNATVILTCGQDVIGAACDAVRDGRSDVLQRPFTLEELRLRVRRAIEVRRLGLETRSLRGERDLIYRTNGFIAESLAIKRVLATVERVATTDATVLLSGETGTGKELVAAAIHYGSPRSGNAFVRVNCAALPDELLESELFGHEKGAFTGAHAQRIGRFELADGGSIFLDEIGDMNLTTQAKVLRVLQEREFQRVGSSATLQVDVRVIVASNRDLAHEVRAKSFREDLYYRLNVIHIHLPPLRERTEDIVPLAQYFVKKIGGDIKSQARTLSDDAKNKLRVYDWPGNVRELRNTIERALILTDGSVIGADDLDLQHNEQNAIEAADARAAAPIDLRSVERETVVHALESCDWVQKSAAELLGISRRALNYRIKKLGIRHPTWRANS